MLDSIDRKILELVQVDAKCTAEELGSHCNLSPTAALKRYKRLKEAGVIRSEVAVLDRVAIGRPILVLALVTFERDRLDIVDNFKKSIKSVPEIMQGFYITGDYDFALLISAESIEDYDAFTRKYFYGKHEIRTFKTMVIMDAVKFDHAYPV